MNKSKNLFYKSQAEISDTIEMLEEIIKSLKNFMQDCEEDIISDNNMIIQTTLRQDNSMIKEL